MVAFVCFNPLYCLKKSNIKKIFYRFDFLETFSQCYEKKYLNISFFHLLPGNGSVAIIIQLRHD